MSSVTPFISLAVLIFRLPSSIYQNIEFIIKQSADLKIINHKKKTNQGFVHNNVCRQSHKDSGGCLKTTYLIRNKYRKKYAACSKQFILLFHILILAHHNMTRSRQVYYLILTIDFQFDLHHNSR